MKIAILFYGRLNKFREHKDNLLNSLGRDNEVDIFLSCSNEPDNIFEQFVDLYKPKAALNQNIVLSPIFLQLLENRYKRGGNTNNVILHFINKLNLIKLLSNYIDKTKIKYDIVISLRFELLLYNNFNFDNHINNSDYIYIPDCNNYDGVNDQIAYGNFEAMKKYMSLFNNIIYIIKNKNNLMHPETLVRENIDYYNLKIIRFNLNYVIAR
jgi:hypothetical protein